MFVCLRIVLVSVLWCLNWQHIMHNMDSAHRGREKIKVVDRCLLFPARLPCLFCLSFYFAHSSQCDEVSCVYFRTILPSTALISSFVNCPACCPSIRSTASIIALRMTMTTMTKTMSMMECLITDWYDSYCMLLYFHSVSTVMYSIIVCRTLDFD